MTLEQKLNKIFNDELAPSLLQEKSTKYGYFNNEPVYEGCNFPLTGTWGTDYAYTKTMQLQEKTMFQMFHGICYDYLKFFINKNPDWKPLFLVRESNYGGVQLIHAFAYKKDNDKILFADARGITDDAVLFFSDFCFSDSAKILDNSSWYSEGFFDELEDIRFVEDCNLAYSEIYGDASVEIA